MRWLILALGICIALAVYTLGTEAVGVGFVLVVSLAFLVGVPFALAFAAVLAARPKRGWVGVLIGWSPSLLIAALLAVGGWEGAICLVMSAPLILLGATAGSVAAFNRIARATPAQMVAVLVAPLLLMPIEGRLPPADRLRESVTEIEIAANAERVWDEIADVDTIRPTERGRALYTAIGFPAPLAATLDLPQEGGVRVASFERGFTFIETITEWEPGTRLAFAIEPLDAGLEPALDPHVRVGGQYFDVLRGTYELEPAGEDRVLLRLRSAHRVTTRFNFYAGWWADRVMVSVQRNILAVIKARSEDASRAPKARIRAATRARAARESRLSLDATSVGTGFSLEGTNRGAIDVYADSIVVLVRDATVHDGPGSSADRLDSITASVAHRYGRSWSPGPPSPALVVESVLAPGETRPLGPLTRLTIPRGERAPLADGWVVITYHLTVPRTGGNPSGLAWTYAHDARRTLSAP